MGCFLRIVLLVIVILIALPFIDKGVKYAKERWKDTEDTVEDIIHNINN